MSLATMIASIRKALKDDRYVNTAFSVGCTDEAVTRALIEITSGGHLITTITDGNALALDLDLSSANYDTVGKLQNYLAEQEGYSATQVQGMEESFPSIEIEPTGPMSILGTAYDLRTRIFSDAELEQYINRALGRHNPSLTVDTLPAGEEHLVITLCQAELMRVLANDSVRRKNMEMTVEELLRLAEMYEKMYKDDATRLARVISPPRETAESVGVGDIMVGDLIRTSKRTGVAYPISAPLGQDCPVEWLATAEQRLFDTSIEVRWTRKRPFGFWKCEIWRDTNSNVRRMVDQDADPTTSTLVLATPNMAKDFFLDTELEPQTTYYYKVYIIDTTGEYRESPVMSLTTLAERVHFGAVPVSPTAGPATTPIAIGLTSFPASTVLTLGGKTLTGTWDSLNFVFNTTVPTFTQKGKKDLVVRSPTTGLFEVKQASFEVT